MQLYDPEASLRPVDYGNNAAHGPDGLIGPDPTDPEVVVVANGGSDLIYLPRADAKSLAPNVVRILLDEDYVSGIFVDSKLGKFAGTLGLDDIALEGSAVTPHPAIAISFRSFDTVCGEPVRCAVEVADTVLQEGQGMHGSFSRADTWNFMAMQGPDFKSRFIDPAPASNADIGRTIAHLLGLDVSHPERLVGRVLAETLPGGALPDSAGCTMISEAAANGLATVLNMQFVGKTRYFDAAGFSGRTVGLSSTPRPCPKP